MMKFDSIIKEKLDGFEAPANPNAWAELETAMNGSTTPFFAPMAAGIAATAVLTVLFVSMPDIRPTMDERDVELEVAHTESTYVENHDAVSYSAQDHAPQEIHKIALEPIAISPNTPSEIQNSEIKTPSSEPAMDPITKDESVVVEGTTPEMNFSAKGIQCVNSSVSFTAELAKAGTVTWLMEGLHVYEGLSVVHRFATAGEHNVRMVTTFADGSEYAIERSITIYGNPIAEHSHYIADQNSCFSTRVEFTGTPGTNTYKWLINGDTVGKGGAFEIELSQGLHTAGMHAINKEGCTSYQSFPIRVEDGFSPLIPNAFTPTNLDGRNDVYEIVGLEDAASYQIVIRRASTQQVVFESNESVKWDGSIMGSAERPSSNEVFLMTVKITDDCGETKEIHQKITYL